MTTFGYLFITFITSIIFIGGILTVFKTGKTAGIAKYTYVSEE